MPKYRKILANLLIIFVLYQCADAIALACRIRFPPATSHSRGPLPNHWLFAYTFRAFAVFSNVIMYNNSFSARGLPERISGEPGRPTKDMIDLEVYQYFPDSFGEAQRRLRLDAVPGRHHEEVYRLMADNIQRLHNERYPEQPVAQVFIYSHWWHKGSKTYFENSERANATLKGHN